MKTKEIFLKDPLAWKLVNEGVSSNNTEDLDTLMEWILQDVEIQRQHISLLRLTGSWQSQLDNHIASDGPYPYRRGDATRRSHRSPGLQ